MANKQLTIQQQMGADLWIARGHGANRMTMQQIAEEVGVSRRTLYDWTKLPAWEEYCSERSKEVMKDNVPEIMNNLIRLATTSSSVKAIELALRVAGVYNPSDKVQLDVTNMEQEDRSTEAKRREIEELRRMLGYEVVKAPEQAQITKQEQQRAEIEALKRNLLN